MSDKEKEKNDQGKTCNSCNTWKPFSNFNVDPSSKDGYRCKCKSCMKKQRDEKAAEIKNKILTQKPEDVGTKTCNKCENDFPKTQEYFELNSTTADGFRNICIKCRKTDGKKYLERDDGYFTNLINKVKKEFLENIIDDVKKEFKIDSKMICKRLEMQNRKCLKCSCNIGTISSSTEKKAKIAQLENNDIWIEENTKILCEDCYKDEKNSVKQNTTIKKDKKIKQTYAEKKEEHYERYQKYNITSFTCDTCNEEKSLDNFRDDPFMKDGKRKTCNSCFKQNENEKLKNMDTNQQFIKKFKSMIVDSRKFSIQAEKEKQIHKSFNNLDTDSMMGILLKQDMKCFIGGQKLQTYGDNVISIKRIDNERGFTIDNIVFISFQNLNKKINSDTLKEEKNCFDCNIIKPLNQFNSKLDLSGTKNVCKICEEKKERKDEAIDKILQKKITKLYTDALCTYRKWSIDSPKKQFSISKNQIREIFDEQEGLCKNTNKPLIENYTVRMSLKRQDINQGFLKENCKLIYC